MIRAILFLFGPKFSRTLVYMLQGTEYQPGSYLSWFWRTKDFRQVIKRRTLVLTRAAKLLLLAVRIGMLLQIIVGVAAMAYGIQQSMTGWIIVGFVLLVCNPFLWAHLIVVPLLLARTLLVNPKNKRLVRQSADVFKQHSAVKIAVAGSYGKTTVKELLLTILKEGKRVAATPANKNVAISHAIFASKLAQDEEVLVIEYGEGQPGDVARFAATTTPDIGIITGLAPAHLDKYKTLDAAARDIFSLADYLGDKPVYVNAESEPLKPYSQPHYQGYSYKGVAGWKVSDISVSLDGLSFSMSKGKTKLDLTSQLVGRHLVGPLALCAAIAHDLGLSDEQITKGVANTQAFEHRMQPRLLAGGWVIDDTYNGNLEGVRAGLALLRELEAKRKIYVTPGLVDQGAEAQRVHKELGRLIAEANPTKVVLMQNSVTDWIQQGLQDGEYKGEVVIEDEPLAFYKNLDQIIAVGDVVLMQNDWTDNYN